jgi:catechol 2,3-dioxygenase-like lactoylglutathione lyase family enzyme
MKMKSISGLTCIVKDTSITASFYEALGFELKNQDEKSISAYLNWFWIDFIKIGDSRIYRLAEESDLKVRCNGLLINISVENVDEFYSDLLSKGIKPLTEPQDQPWSNREFIVEDPDGYRLVFFKRI